MMAALQESLYFGIAETEVERDHIDRLRQDGYARREHYLIADGRTSDCFDEVSSLFYLRIGEQIVATSRVTPQSAAWELDTISLPPELSRRFDRHYVQYSRVLVNSAFRNQNLHVLMFYNVAKWMLENTEYRLYVSVCRRPLVRLYTHVGARLASEHPFMIPGRQHPYYLVEGAIETVRDTSAEILQRIQQGTASGRPQIDTLTDTLRTHG